MLERSSEEGSGRMAMTLRWLALTIGIACVAIGVFHFILGIDSVPGEGNTGATVDSRERFYAAIFLGYGIAWIWAARQSPVPSTTLLWKKASALSLSAPPLLNATRSHLPASSPAPYTRRTIAGWLSLLYFGR